MPRIEIFRPGKHVAMNGAEIEFSSADIDGMVASYDPAVHEAPIVVGHPRADAPAYGWVKGLDKAGGTLNADACDIDPAFAELLKERRYSKVSASFYLPNSKTNPKPGNYYLRHVGFLGAMPPAIKGLRPVEFSGDGDDAVSIEFGDWNDITVARMFRGLRDWLIGKFGTEEADKAMPSWNVDSVQEEAARPEPGELPSYAESVIPERNASPAPVVSQPSEPMPAPSSVSDEKARELEARERSVREKETALKRKEQEAARAEHRAFCEGLVREGRPLPCSVDLVAAFCAYLDGDETVSFVEYGESTTPVALFKTEFLRKLPKRVAFGERVSAEEEPVDTDDAAAFAERIRQCVAEHKARGEFITTADAASLLRNGA